jgi:nicotinamide phosphoribosyltransferase
MEFLMSNSTARSDKNFRGLADFDHKMVNYGVAGVCKWLLRDLWNETFFNVPKEQAIRKYKRRMDNSLGVGAVSIEYFSKLYDLGYLPISVLTLPEGTRVDMRVPNVLFYSTHPDFAWVVNYIETQFENEIWKPCTTATTAFEFRRLAERYAKKTGVSRDAVMWQCHDFSDRGLSGNYDAAQSGSGHLLSFTGTDTIQAIDYLEDYYNADSDKEMVGGSIPASEHSVACSNILSMTDEEFAVSEPEFDQRGIQYNCPDLKLTPERKRLIVGEYRLLKRFLTILYPSGFFSFVSDTFDFWSVLTQIAPRLTPEIMGRDGRVVFRPDSGDPVKIVIGDPTAGMDSPAFAGAVKTLYKIFGGIKTPKGFITVDSHVGLIYGDSINLERVLAIFEGLLVAGFSSGNIVFGIGSFTYQLVSRDSLGQAMKATYIKVKGRGIELYKDPLTDNGIKKSARGMLKVTWDDVNHKYTLEDRQTDDILIMNDRGEWELTDTGAYVEIFRNSVIKNDFTLIEMRGNINREIDRLLEND